MAAGNVAPEVQIDRVSPGDPAAKQFTVNPEIAERVEQAQRMEALRDIHLPDGVSPWPPAPGWWGVLVLLVLVSLIARWIIRRLTGPNLRASARRELAALDALFSHAPPAPETETEKRAELLRRIAAALGIDSPDWVAPLAERLGVTLTEPVARTLGAERYRARPNLDLEGLRAFTEAVIAALPRDPGHAARKPRPPSATQAPQHA